MKAPYCPYCMDGIIVKDKADVLFCNECLKEVKVYPIMHKTPPFC